MRSVPTDYYATVTGVGVALSNRDSDRSLKVGVIGLGIGTLAAYGKPGDLFRFYEINPDVVRIARDAGYFSYLSDSKAEIEIIEGDGRLSLESELRAGGGEQYDLLVLDAFNSDSVPIHLLTINEQVHTLITSSTGAYEVMPLPVINRGPQLRQLLL